MGRISDNEEVRLQVGRMSKTATVLYRVFAAAAVLFAVIDIGALVLVLKQGLDSGEPPLGVMMSTLPYVFVFAIGLILLIVLMRAFSDVSREKTPFTIVQANRIRLLGILLLAYCVVEAILSADPLRAEINDLVVQVHASPGIFFDAKLLIAAIVCFCLSYVFRYGALLQWLQDETL